jgi:hypothetical protein
MEITNLPEPITDELWLKIDQAHGVVYLANHVARNHLCGEAESALASSLEAALTLLLDARSLVDKCRGY